MKALWKGGLARAEAKDTEKAMAELEEALRIAEELNVPTAAREIRNRLAEIRPKPAVALEQPGPTLTESEYWGWVEVFAQRKDLAGLTAETRKYTAPLHYGLRVFNALWERLREAEKANDGAKLRKYKAETEILAKALKEGCGISEPLERWRASFTLDPATRKVIEKVTEELQATLDAAEKKPEKTLPALLALVEMLRAYEGDSKTPLSKLLRATARCHAELKDRAKAEEALQESIRLAHELGDLDAVREMDEELARIRKG
ncbi:MAG: hypothetical protein L0216_21965 [Planctomycetales bacterium]|nr:hypothetical protein [Planctomycetales bacterium]